MLGYDNLMNHYKTNFALMQHHKYSLGDLETMIPWERYIYISLLKQYLEEQEQKMKDAEAAAAAARRVKR
jgi:hypothetical protein